MSGSLPKISRYVFRIQVQASDWSFCNRIHMQGLSEPKAVTSTNTKHLSNMNTLVRRYKTNIYSNQLDVWIFLQRIVGELLCGNMWKRRKMSFPRLSSPSLPTTSTWTVRPTSIDRWTFNKNKPDKRSFTPTFDFLCYFNTPLYINIWQSNSSLKVQARRRQYWDQINLEPFLATNNVTVRPRKSCKF